MKRPFIFASMLCFALVVGSAAQAQPDPDNAPKGTNPPVRMPGIGAGEWQKMTPEQRRQALQASIEQTLRGAMTWLGYTDRTLQDTVVAAALAREKSLMEVRDKHRLVTQALLAKQTDAQMDIALDNLRLAQEDAADERVKQIADLDKKTGFSTKPRLKAFLSQVGLIGDDSATIGGVLGSTMNSMTNMAMGAEAPAPNGENPQPPKAPQDAAEAPANEDQ